MDDRAIVPGRVHKKLKIPAAVTSYAVASKGHPARHPRQTKDAMRSDAGNTGFIVLLALKR